MPTIGGRDGIDVDQITSGAQAAQQCPTFGSFNPVGATVTLSEQAFAQQDLQPRIIGEGRIRNNISEVGFVAFMDHGIFLSELGGLVGDTVTVTVELFDSLDSVNCFFNGVQVTTIPASPVALNASGNATFTFVVPNLPKGDYQVLVTEVTGIIQKTQIFSIER